MSTLKYTKAIRAGRLKATEMEVGESVTGILKGFKQNQYGKDNLILEVMGKDVEVFSAGNLTFIARDVADGKKALGLFTVITRVENKTLKDGRSASQFNISQTGAEAAATTPTPTANAPVASVKDQLAAIRASKIN